MFIGINICIFDKTMVMGINIYSYLLIVNFLRTWIMFLWFKCGREIRQINPPIQILMNLQYMCIHFLALLDTSICQ